MAFLLAVFVMYRGCIDCESLADTCEDNLAEIEDIMEVPEHSEVTKMQSVDNEQNEKNR